jgi:glycosyltransferase involved in cell wall biosynthesis
MPFITVCMPVRNEERFIGETLNELLSQDYPGNRYEIIVADGESNDQTAQVVKSIAEKHPNVILVGNAKRRSSAGRNIGFKNGKGEIFLVLDGHCYIGHNQLFKNVVICLEKSGADCLGRPQPLNPPGLTAFQQAVGLARASRIGHGGDSYIYTDFEGFVSPTSNGAIYRREIFSRVGYVDEHFDACEDVEFNYRVEQAGFKAYMSPELRVKYYPRQDLKSLFGQMVRYGSGRYRLYQKHPDTLTINTLIPLVFVISVLAALLAALLITIGLVPSWVGLLASSALGAYLFVIVVQSVLISAKTKATYFPYLLPIFFIIHFGLGWGFIKTAMEGLKK